jgi:hypothetical protein
VVAAVVVVIDEGGDLPFEVSRQEVRFQQYAVIQGLVPAFDLALGLGMVWRAADVLDASRVRSATTSLSAAASARSSFTSGAVAYRAVSPASRCLPALRNSFDQL